MSLNKKKEPGTILQHRIVPSYSCLVLSEGKDEVDGEILNVFEINSLYFDKVVVKALERNYDIVE